VYITEQLPLQLHEKFCVNTFLNWKTSSRVAFKTRRALLRPSYKL